LLFRRYTDAGGSSGSLFTSGTDGRFLLQVTHAGPDTVDGDAGWSRDGSRIVFTRYSHVGTDAETHQVLTANADGSNVKRLTPPTLEHSATGLVFNDQAAFSPDGRWIASVTGGGHVKNDQIEHSDVAVMRADGTGRRLITRFPAYAGDAGGVAWSPDGRRLVYGYGDAVTHRVALFVMKADGTGSSRITDWDIGAGVRSIGRLTES
jgi:Tol biopolymer transport system component